MEPLAEDGTRSWTEPGIYSVAPGVYRIPLPLPGDGLRAVNVYAITNGTDLVMIDSGWALTEAREQLAASLKGIGAEPGDVSQFLVTHVHRDHYTLAVALRREFGNRIGLGEHEQASLRKTANPDETTGIRPLDLLFAAGADELAQEMRKQMAAHPPREVDWEAPDEWLTPGRRTIMADRALDIVHTPGHTTGHVVFDDGAAGLMFTGDHVLPHITPSIGHQPAPSEMPLREFLGSLRLVRGMPDRRMLPAHGPVSPSVHQRVDELLEHHDERLARTAEAVSAGATTAYEAASKLGWTRRLRKFAELDPFNQTLAVNETLAHLDLLVHQGRMNVSTVDGVKHFSLP